MRLTNNNASVEPVTLAECRGDPSNEFRFATFFPEALHPAVDRTLAVFERCLPIGRDVETAEAGYLPGTAPLPGSDNADATRRRLVSHSDTDVVGSGQRGCIAQPRPFIGIFASFTHLPYQHGTGVDEFVQLQASMGHLIPS